MIDVSEQTPPTTLVSATPGEMPLSPQPRPGYIKALDGSPMYAVYHPASAEAALPAVVIAGSLFEERKSAYVVLRTLAERLAARGHPVLRFDYRGAGESGGSTITRRWQHLVEDLTVARRTLTDLSGRSEALLIGLRLGGTLVLQEALRARCLGVIAIAPVIKGAMQVRLWKMRSKIRAELTQERTAKSLQSVAVSRRPEALPADIIDFDGYEVSPTFFDDVGAIDLQRDLKPLACPAHLLQVSHRSDAAPEASQLLETMGARAHLDVLRMEPFWDKLDDVDLTPLEQAVLRAAGSGT